MKLRLITLLLFISSVAFGQTNYLQVGNTLQRKDTTITGVTNAKAYRTVLGSPGVAYFPTRAEMLAQSWAISRVTDLQDSLSNKYSKSDAGNKFQPIENQRLSSTNSVSFAEITANNGIGGYVIITSSPTADSTGYIQFFKNDASRHGYIGNSSSGMKYFSDNSTHVFNGSISAGSIIKSGGLSSQFLKADGSTDANIYLTSSTAVTSISGTSGQVIASGSVGDITLSLPQSISTTSSPFFGNLNLGDGVLNSQLLINGASSGVNGGASLAVQNNGITSVSIGNTSNIIGGSYDSTPMFYSGGDLRISPNGVTKMTVGSLTTSFTNFPTITAATSGRIPYFTTAGQITDDADLTFDGTNLSVATPTSGSHVVNKTYADATYAPISITGNVTGPASSIDNEIPRFDGTTGKVLQNSGVYIADGGSISTESSISSSGGLSSFANVQNLGQQYQAKTTITSGSYSVVNDYTIFANAVSGDITVNLPASSSNSGRILVIKKTDPSANTVTIDGNSSETIDGDTTYVLVSQYNGVQIQSDGLNWYVIGFF